MLYEAKTLHKGESLFCGYIGKFYQHEAICNEKYDRSNGADHDYLSKCDNVDRIQPQRHKAYAINRKTESRPIQL
jgi:hypothetical protein